MIFSKWPPWFVQACGGLPSRYVAWDLEAMGCNVAEALIWQVGHVVVIDGKVEDRFEAILNWSDSDLLRSDTVQEMLQKHQLTSKAAPGGDRLSWDRLVKEGQKPEYVLTEWTAQLHRLQTAGFKFVGHNVYNYDEKVLYQHIHDWDLYPDFQFTDWDLFDTCTLEKLNQLTHVPQAEPRMGDTMRSYMQRAQIPGSPVKSNLAVHCVTKYKLRPPVTSRWDKPHNASYDAYLCYLLMEIFRYSHHQHQVRQSAGGSTRRLRQRNF
jgi:hypothetical protein